MKFLDKLEKAVHGRAIHGLMKYMIAFYIIGYILEYAFPSAIAYITLEPYLIFHQGQVWRLVSWLLIPPDRSYLIFVIIMIIFYYQIGTVLERTWGAFRFNVFIFGGVIFTVIGAIILYFVTGQNYLLIQFHNYFSTYYLNLSIFLAFAICYPEEKVYLYFLLPVKNKWLALVYVILAVFGAVNGGLVSIVAIIAATANTFLFFWMNKSYHGYSFRTAGRRKTFQSRSHQQSAARSGQKNRKRKVIHPGNGYHTSDGRISKHKCAVCGRTELDDPNLEFRFCSKCNGNYEYCQDHLFTHKHIK